jgi:hypothetical protein
MALQTILDSFRDLCSMPVAWGIVAVVALRAGWSLVSFFRCPVLRHADAIDAATARAMAADPHVRSPRFLATMVVGLALSIGGLYALRTPEAGPLALAAIVFGVFLLIVEPSRLSVEENSRRAAAARLEGPDALAFATERLRASHLERLAIEIAMAALLGLLVVIY